MAPEPGGYVATLFPTRITPYRAPPASRRPLEPLLTRINKPPRNPPPANQHRPPPPTTPISKPFPCPYPSCATSYHRKADCRRHVTAVHERHNLTLVDCTVAKCGRRGRKGFTRLDHRTEHLRNFHKLDIPKKRRRGG
ncbi:hypothetical protein P152DRAFT_402557 [Eremomyces bilateralis CBS 781.70]|uniref:C2H2-type domain-containing protein n=1 Tax=Eremomyces bilateralis CBS 781.70 TaxID=1392243 RepID=A0A6G1FVD2_9PEZI|nr:uncharacterized protein P152DRAFT_402557 [Eremomyces bilateralis CBS 781.70]KAF1809723.1 hypothetical protein P152DRAFT_402557 [Eremomyces bilateralis CBS 781.70]